MLASWTTREDKAGLQKDPNSGLPNIQLPLIFSLPSLHIHVFSSMQLNQHWVLQEKRSAMLLWLATTWTPPTSVSICLDTHAHSHMHIGTHTQHSTARTEGHGYDSRHIQIPMSAGWVTFPASLLFHVLWRHNSNVVKICLCPNTWTQFQRKHWIYFFKDIYLFIYFKIFIY